MIIKTNSNYSSGVNLDILLLGESLINSFIRVTYPEGSICTLTDGTTSVTSPNTCGAVAFAIPTAGEWTVSCTNGTDNASKTITVAANTTYDADLAYVFWLIRDGVVITDNTGTWSSLNTYPASHRYVANTGGYEMATITYYDGYMYIGGAGGTGSAVCRHSGNIDLTNYKYLVLDMQTQIASGDIQFQIRSASDTDYDYWNAHSVLVRYKPGTKARQIQNIDITNATGSCFLLICFYGTVYVNAIYNAYLVKDL